jgi:NTE family protein
MPLTPYAARTYFPSANRKGIALCLSGGGFRAALFHLGAVRRLYELGVLQQVRTITAVSGGSLLAAFLARHWHALSGTPLGPAEWNARIADPFRVVTSRHWNMWPQIKGLLLGRNAGVRAIADRIEQSVTDMTLHDLPRHPEFMFCATDLVRGAPWIFQRTTPTNYRVAMAVAVSSCFPILLLPYIPATPEHLALVDGGVDDDRGIEMVWRTHETLLVSDGGDALRPRWGRSLAWSWFRSASVLWNASQEIQRRWLLSSFEGRQLEGTYWAIDSSVSHYEDSKKDREPYHGYSPALARDLLAVIRTSYDRFSLIEAAVLENHGYLLTDAAIRTHLPGMPTRRAPLRIPNPGWMREDLIRQALVDSATKISG